MDKYTLPDPEEEQDDSIKKADEDQADQSNELPKHIPSLQEQKKRKKIAGITIAVFVFIAGVLGSMAIIRLAMDEPERDQQSEQQQTAEPVSTPIITSETENYNSPQFFLSFDHPEGWEVNDDRVAGKLTVTSPELQIPGETGDTSGKVIFEIRSKKAELPEFESGNAVAVVTSEKVEYTNPSQAQRGETYLSFLSYADSPSSGLIDGVFVTGDFGYKQGQAIPKVDIQKIDPIISLSFAACDGTCDVPVSITPSAWQQEDFGRQIQKMIQSLHIN